MWLACQRASWEPRLPMRMGLRGLLCSLLIILTRIRDAWEIDRLQIYFVLRAERVNSESNRRRFFMKIAQVTNRRGFLAGMAAASAAVMMPEVAGAATD